jgi:DNA polymerase III delta prime subunit
MYDPFAGKASPEIDEIKASARALVNDPGMKEAINILREGYIQTLLSEQVGSLTAQDAHARLRTLEQFKHELTNLAAERGRLSRRR